MNAIELNFMRSIKIFLFWIACLLGLSNYAIAQSITSFTPIQGEVGTTVTISGTGFNTTANNNVVIFGATRATVTTATATELTVNVPTGATYAPITVLDAVTGLLASSKVNFMPTFTPEKSTLTNDDFDAKVPFTTEEDPYSLAIGDLDGDGKADLAIANFSSNTVSVLRNTGSSGNLSYATRVDFTTGSNPISVAIGDLDGDGKADLAVANFSSTTVSVLRNESSVGTISYAAKQDFLTGTKPHFVAIGDVDGDGKADLAIANRGTNTVSILQNTSSIESISYAAKQDFITNGNPYALAIGDLDADGKADLAVANYSSNTISVFRNTSNSGSINYATKVNFSTATGPYSVAIGDLDGDSKADLAVANHGSTSVSILRSTSSVGTISYEPKVDFSTGSQPISVAIGDLNGDGKADLAVADYGGASVSVLRNASSIGAIDYAEKVSLSTNNGPTLVGIGDLDSDGKSDIAVTTRFSDVVSVFRYNPNMDAPRANAYSPSDNATQVASDSDLVLTFNEDVQKGSGNIVIKEDGEIAQTIPVTDGSVTVSGNTVSINPADFTAGASVNIEMQPGVFKDLADNNFAGITAATDWNFSLALASQSITFNELTPKNLSDDDFDLTATASSGLEITYSSSNTSVATVSGNTVTIIGTGTTTITASQAGNSNYGAADPVDQTLTVYKDKQTINFDVLPIKTLLDTDFDLNATASSGLEITYSSSDPAVATVSGNTVTIVGLGTTTITASQAGNSNFQSAYPVDQTLTVNKATQTINFDAFTPKTFGDDSFNLTAEASSGLTVTFSSSNNAVATVSGTTVTIIGAGTTTISAAQAGNSIYRQASPIKQTLIVNKAEQTITFEPFATKTYGDAAFKLSATVNTGFAITYTSSDEAVASLEGDYLTINGTGTATITASASGGPNYEAISEERTLTVNKAAQSITFEPLPAKTFGDADFELTASVDMGFDISYSTSDETVATVSGSTVTIVGAGTTTITANQAGDQNFEEAAAVEQILTVIKADQSISVTPIADKFVSDASFNVEATVDSGLDLTYSLTGPASIDENTITLAGTEGTVTITVRQAGNDNFKEASATASFEVSDPCKNFDAQAINIENVACNGESNGSFEVSATGTDPFIYTLNGTDQEASLFSGLEAGNYEVIVTDGNNCSKTISAVIAEPDAISANSEITGSTSISGNGSISLTAIGGTGNLNFEWSNGATTANISELKPGEYSVTITDDNNCSLTENFTVGGVTANEEALNQKVSLYPNPTSSIIKVQHAKEVEKIRLYNAQGQLIQTQKATATESTLQMSHMPMGIYLIQLDNSSTLHRVIKK